jgi:hypothetical protein
MALSPSPARTIRSAGMTRATVRSTRAPHHRATRPPNRPSSRTTRGGRVVRIVVLAVTTVLATLVVTTPAQAAYCGITWGSLPKVATGSSGATDYMTNVRAGQHACYDRLVIDLASASGYNNFDVRYVSQVRMDGSGNVVPVRGGAKLEIIVRSTPYDNSGRVTYRPANRAELANVSGYRTFRQVAWAGAFEGQSTVGLGVRARLPFRAFVLAGPTAGSVRVVVDVAHLW